MPASSNTTYFDFSNVKLCASVGEALRSPRKRDSRLDLARGWGRGSFYGEHVVTVWVVVLDCPWR